MMHKADNQSVRTTTLKNSELDSSTVQSGACEPEQPTSCSRHALVNANHAILLGVNLLSRYWEDIVSCLDQCEVSCEDGSLFSDDCLEARKNGAVVIASIAESARKMEAQLIGLQEGAKDSVDRTA